MPEALGARDRLERIAHRTPGALVGSPRKRRCDRRSWTATCWLSDRSLWLRCRHADLSSHVNSTIGEDCLIKCRDKDNRLC